MSSSPDTPATGRGRVAWLDRARGAALVAMIVFHGCFDLAFLGFVDWPVGRSLGWWIFAACIVTAFLALSGISLQIAHGRGVRWRSFRRRLALLAGAAALVTLATWTAMPVPVFFGILHAIAFFSLLALPFLALPSWVAALAIPPVIAAPFFLTAPAFSHWAFYPLGLSPAPVRSFDYEPVFPWFAAMLLGLVLGRVVPLPRRAPRSDLLARMGRNSLAIYLLHQPILLGVLIATRALAQV